MCVCAVCILSVFSVLTAVSSSLQDDGDVEDDMTIREVRLAAAQNIQPFRVQQEEITSSELVISSYC